MTEEQWNRASEEEKNAEFDRCKDPVYVYNTYWRMPDGSKPNPITHEQYEQMRQASLDYLFHGGRMRRRYQPVSLEVEQTKDFNKWRVEEMKLNPATEAMLKWIRELYDDIMSKAGIPEHLIGKPTR